MLKFYLQSNIPYHLTDIFKFYVLFIHLDQCIVGILGTVCKGARKYMKVLEHFD